MALGHLRGSSETRAGRILAVAWTVQGRCRGTFDVIPPHSCPWSTQFEANPTCTEF